MALFFQSNLANQKHPPLSGHAMVSQQKKRERPKPWICLVTPAAWHFLSDAQWHVSRKCTIMRGELRREQCVREIPGWGPIFSLTDEAGRIEWATPEHTGVLMGVWVVASITKHGGVKHWNLIILRCVCMPKCLCESRECVWRPWEGSPAPRSLSPQETECHNAAAAAAAAAVEESETEARQRGRTKKLQGGSYVWHQIKCSSESCSDTQCCQVPLFKPLTDRNNLLWV